ncbi:MAG: dihydrofolate reductase family protein [Bacteroidota bacterium]
MPKNIVFIATSLDGFIAGKNGELDWLEMVPNPHHDDLGYTQLMEEVDAIVMGRITTIPILLGGGFPLFGELTKPLAFEHSRTEIFLDQLVQRHYRRKR